MASKPPEQTGALVVGSTGLIGRSLMVRLHTAYHPVLGTVRRESGDPRRSLMLDLSRDIVEQRLLQFANAIQVVYLCGAVSRFEDCERNRQTSYLVNVQNTVRVAELLAGRGVTIVFLSSSAVFCGENAFEEEEAVPLPTTEYGRQKAEAEKRLRSLAVAQGKMLANVIIVRLAKVLSVNLPLVAGWLEKLRKGESITAFDDLVMAPVSLDFATEFLVTASQAKAPATFHISGDMDVSYYDFACCLARKIGVNEKKVIPISSAESGKTISYRPRFNALSMKHTSRITGTFPQTLETVVDDILKESDA